MTPSVETARRLAADEYADLIGFLESLDVVDWDAPTLCADWTVRDLVTHVVAWDEIMVLDDRRDHVRSLVRLAAMFARSRGSMRRINHRFVAAHCSEPDALVARMKRLAGLRRRIFDRLGPGVQVAEYVVHHQDIRRPLRRPRAIPDGRLRVSLDSVAGLPGLGGPSRLRGLRLVATDLDWTRGSGLLVEAPAETLLMALAGRPVDASELGGPGAARFSS